MGKVQVQKLKNLPDELLRQPRFFRVGRDVDGVFDVKAPIDKWNNPKNQRYYNKLKFTDNRQMAGFDIVGHGNADDYLVLDFDHVLDDKGQFVNDELQLWYNYAAQSGTYIEKSISGHGLHAIFKPAQDEFPSLASGSKACLYFGDNVKIEIYYKTGGKYFLFTGYVYNCEPNTPISTDCSVIHDLLNEIGNRAKKNSEKNIADPYLIQCARDMLEFIPCNIRTNTICSTWLSVGKILKKTGNPIEDWLEWSKKDSARYDEAVCRELWNTFSDSEKYVRDDNEQRKNLYIKTLNYWAKEHGYITPSMFYVHLDFDIIPDDIEELTAAQIETTIKSDNVESAVKSEMQVNYSDNPVEYEMARALEMLKYINPSALQDNDWLSVMTACKNLGIPESVVDDWNMRDPKRYNERQNKIRYDSLKSPNFGMDNLHEKAKHFGYVERDFKRQWYRENPQFKNYCVKQHFKKEGIEYIPLNSLSESQNFILPAGYDVTTRGVFKFDSKGNVKQVSKKPICISALYYRDSDDTRLVDIWTLDTDGRELVISRVEKDVISDTKKLTALSARGLSVTSSTSKDLVDYLYNYIDANQKILKPQKLLTKLGWYAEDLFVTPYGKQFNLDIERLGNFAESLQQKGSFDDWKALAKEVMNYPVARFTLAACLAPPLLRILGERTFSVYLMCDSKAGKSAVAKFGGSCWGDENVTRNLRATINGLEGELAECTDFPFIADEKQLAENMNMSKLAYLIAQGQGKGRMTKDVKSKKRRQWRTIGILGGEEIITDEMATQGAITRTLSIIVKDTQIIPKDLAKKIYHSIHTNYGWAGQCFIDNLLAENFDELRELKEYFTLQLESRGKLIDDYYRYIALISVADCLMQRYFFDVTADAAVENAFDNAVIIANMIQSEKELSDAEREWALISGWIAENRGLILNNPNFVSTNSKGDELTPAQNKIIGVYGGDSVFIIVSALKDYCKRQGLNYSKVIRDLERSGYIVRGKDRPTQCKWIEGANTRVVQFQFSLDEENS